MLSKISLLVLSLAMFGLSLVSAAGIELSPTWNNLVDGDPSNPTANIQSQLALTDANGSNQWVWAPLPLESWSFATGGANVLGFRDGTIYDYQQPPHVVRVNGATNRKVEVLAEAEDGSRICVQDLAATYNTEEIKHVRQCGTGRLNVCFPGPIANSLTDSNGNVVQDAQDIPLDLNFYCDQGCEGQINFKYRIRISLVQWNETQDDARSNLDMWCMMMNQRYDAGSSLQAADFTALAAAETRSVWGTDDSVKDAPTDIAVNFVPQKFPSDLQAYAQPNEDPSNELPASDNAGIYDSNASGKTVASAVTIIAMLFAFVFTH